MSKVAIVEKFFSDFEKVDLSSMAKSICDNVKSYITAEDGDVFILDGRSAFINNLKNMHAESLDFLSVKPTQIAEIDGRQVIVMVEIQAAKSERKLHNFAAFLLTFNNQCISEIRMVEALPMKSADFWSK